MQRLFLGLILAGTLLTRAVSQSPAASAIASDSEIRNMLVERIDKQHKNVGIVVGVLEPSGRRIVSYGSLAKGDPRPLNGDTVFEIGSVSKVFTSLVLADMARKGEVALTDPAAKYLPATVKMPEHGGKQITLLDLATQTSGLPRLPSNMTLKDPANPYADYTPEQLYQFLSGYTLTRDPGSKYEYSNLGMGLLGHLLARRAGTDYETLVRTRICDPLGMSSTRVTLSPAMKARMAGGHNDNLEAVANWDLPTLAGAGALRSTANDLLTFLAAALGDTKTPIGATMASMLAVRRATGFSGLEIALAWHITTQNGHEIVWHNGGTAGYRSYVAFDLKRHLGVVVLINTNSTAGPDDIGQHLLDPTVALSPPPKEHKAVAIDSKLLDGYVGRYQLAQNFIITVTREDTRLFVQATGQPKFEVFPESNRDFFLKAVDAQVTFETDSQGRARTLILHQGGGNQAAPRMEGDAPTSKEHKAIVVDTRLYAGYVGRYELVPDFILTITQENGHLFLQATGQPKLEIFPESDRDYFLKEVDAQVTFETDSQGKATGLVLHQGGDRPARRIE